MMERKQEGRKSIPPPASSRVSVMQEGINLAEDLNGEQCPDERTLSRIKGTFLEKSEKLSSKISVNDWRFDVVMRAKELSKQNTKLKTRLIKARSEASNLAEALVAANDRMVDLTMVSTRMKIHMRDVQPNIKGPFKINGYPEAGVKNLEWFPQQSKGIGLSVSNENLPLLTATAERSSQQKKRTHYLSRSGDTSKKRLTGDENCPSLKRMASSVHQRSWKMDEDTQNVDMKTSPNIEIFDLHLQLQHAENELRCNQASSEIQITKLKEETTKLKEKLKDRKLDLKSAQKSETIAVMKADECSADVFRISEILSTKEVEMNALRLQGDGFDTQNRGLTEELETLRNDLSIKRDVEDTMSNKLKMMETSLATIREELRCERKGRKRNEDERTYCEVLQLKLNQANERATILEDELERTRTDMGKTIFKPPKQQQWNAARVRPQSCSVERVSHSTTTTTNGNGAILKDNNNNTTTTSVLGLATQSVAEKENRQEPSVVECVAKNELLPHDGSSMLIPASAATGNHSSNNIVEKDDDTTVKKYTLLSCSNLIDELQKERDNTQSLKNEISRLKETAREMVRLSEFKTLQSNLGAEKVRNRKLTHIISVLQSSLDKEKACTEELTLSLNAEKGRSEEMSGGKISMLCSATTMDEMVTTYASSSEMEELKIALDKENACARELMAFLDEVRLSLNDEKKTTAHVMELLAFLSYTEALRLSLNREKDNVKVLTRDLDAENERVNGLVEEVSELQSSNLESASMLDMEALRSRLAEEKSRVNESLSSLALEKTEGERLRDELSSIQNSTAAITLDKENLKSSLDKEKAHTKELMSALDSEKIRNERLMDEISNLNSIAMTTSKSLSDLEILTSSLHKEQYCTEELMKENETQRLAAQEMSKELSVMNDHLIKARAVIKTTGIGIISPTTMEILPTTFNKSLQFHQPLPYRNEYDSNMMLDLPGLLIENRRLCKFGKQTVKCLQESVQAAKCIKAAANEMFVKQPVIPTRKLGNAGGGFSASTETMTTVPPRYNQQHLKTAIWRRSINEEEVMVNNTINGYKPIKDDAVVEEPSSSLGVVASSNGGRLFEEFDEQEGGKRQQQQKQITVFDSGKGCRNKALETIMREVSSLRHANDELKSIDLERVVRIESLSEQLSNTTKRLKTETLRATHAEEALTKAMNGSGLSLSGSKDENRSSSKIQNFSASASSISEEAEANNSSLVVSLRERCKQLESTNAKLHDDIRETVGEETLRRHHFAEKAKFDTEIDLLENDLQMKSELALHLQREVKLLTEKMQLKDIQIERSVMRMPELEEQLTEAECVRKSQDDRVSELSTQLERKEDESVQHIANVNVSKRAVENMSCKLLDVESKLATVEKRAKELENKLGKKQGFNHDEDVLFKTEQLEDNTAAPVMKYCNELEEANAAGKVRRTTTLGNDETATTTIFEKEAAQIGGSLVDIESRNAELENEKREMMRELAEMVEKMECTQHEGKCSEEGRASALKEHKNQVKLLENALTVKEDGLQRAETTSNELKARETLLKETLAVRSAEVTCLQEKVINIKSDASALNDCLEEEISSLKNELSLAVKDSKQVRKLHAETSKSLDEALYSKAELDGSICLINESIGLKLDEHKAMYQQKAIGLDDEYESMGVYLKNAIIALKALLEQKGQKGQASPPICHLCRETLTVSEAETVALVTSKWEQQQQSTAAALMKDELEFKSEEIQLLQMALEIAKSETASCCMDMKWEIIDLKETQAYMSMEKKELVLSVELLECTLAEQSELLMTMVKVEAASCCHSESGVIITLNEMVQEKEIEFLRNVLIDKEAEIKTALQKAMTLETCEGFEKSKLELSVALLKQEMEKRTEELQRIQNGFSNAVSIAESTNCELKQENSCLKNEIDLMKDELDNNMTFMSAQLSSTLNEMKQLQQAFDLKNDELDNDRSFLKGELVSKSEEVKVFQKRLEDSIAEATSEHIKMKKQLYEKEESLVNVSKEKEDLMTEIASLNVLLTEHSKGVNDVEPRLKAEIASLKLLHTIMNGRRTTQQQQLENELTKHKDELEVLKSDSDTFHSVNADQKVEIISLKNTIKTKTSEFEKLRFRIAERDDSAALAQCVFEKKLNSQADEAQRMQRTIVFSKTEAGLNQMELEMRISFLENSLRLSLEKLERIQQRPPNLNLNCLNFNFNSGVKDGVGSLTSFDPNIEKKNDEVGFMCRSHQKRDEDVIIGGGTKGAFNHKIMNVPLDVVVEDRTTEPPPLNEKVETAAAGTTLNEESRRRTHKNDVVAGLNDDDGCALLKEGCNTSVSHSTVSDFYFRLTSSTEEYSEIKNIEEESALELPPPSSLSSPLSNTLLSVSFSSPEGTKNVQGGSSSGRRSLFVHRRLDQRNNEENMEFGSSSVNGEQEQEQQCTVDEINNDCCNNNDEIAAEVMSCSGSPLDSSELRLFEPEFLVESSKYNELELRGMEDSVISYSVSSSSCESGSRDDKVVNEQHWKDSAIHQSMTMSPSVSPHRRNDNRPWRNKFRSLFRFWGLFSSTTKSTTTNDSEDLSFSYSPSTNNTTTDPDENSEHSSDFSQSKENSSNSSYSITNNIGRKKSERDEFNKSWHSKYETGGMTPQLRREEVTRFYSPPLTVHSADEESENKNHSYSWFEKIDKSAGLLATTIAPLHEPRLKRRKGGGNIVNEQDAVVIAEIVQSPDPLSTSVCTTEADDQSSAIIDIESVRPGWSAVLKQLKEIKLPDPVYYPYWELGF